MTDPAYTVARDAAAQITARLGTHRAVIVLGSGWAKVAEHLGEVEGGVPMSDLPGFPKPSVEGHSGMAHSVACADTRVLVLAGRSHLYEGHPVTTVVHGVRAAVMAGCEAVLLSNAAGSLVAANGPGQPVLIRDQLNLTGTNPMRGPGPPPDLPARFVDLTGMYSARLRAAAQAAMPGLPEGVYAGLEGGPYETAAEIHMLRGMGADLVGMSTVLEAIAARHLGAEVFGVSLVTNLAAGMSEDRLDHEDVLATGAASIPKLAALMAAVVGAL